MMPLAAMALALGIVGATHLPLDADPVPMALPDIGAQWLVYGRSHRLSVGTGISHRFDPTLVSTALRNQGLAWGMPPMSGDTASTCRRDAMCNNHCASVAPEGAAYAACAARWYAASSPGGAIYLQDGLHGAVNLPLFAAAHYQAIAQGPKVGYRVDIDAHLWAAYQHAGGVDVGLLQVRADRLHGQATRYLNRDMQYPWFVEAEVDGSGATWQMAAMRGEPTLHRITLPIHVGFGVGVGRVYPIAQRLRLARVEQILRDANVLDAPLPAPVSRQVLLAWYALRSELGYDQRLLATLQVLQAAGVLRAPLTDVLAYQLERVLAASELVTRHRGHQVTLMARTGIVALRPPGLPALAGPEGAVTTILQASGWGNFNLSLYADVTLRPRVAWAPRARDRFDNAQAEQPLVFAGLQHSRLSVDLPITYTRWRFDAEQNYQGAWDVSARLGVGVQALAQRPGASDASGAMLGVGSGWTAFRSRNLAYRIGAAAEVGYAQGDLAYALSATFRIDIGQSTAIYAGPVQLIDTLPTRW